MQKRSYKLQKERSKTSCCRYTSWQPLQPYISSTFDIYNLLKLDQNDPMSEVILQSQHHECESSKLSITMYQSFSSSFPSIFILLFYFPAYLAFNLQTSIRTNHQTQLRGLFQGAIRQQSTKCIAWWQVVSCWSLQIHVVYSFWVFIMGVVITFIFSCFVLNFCNFPMLHFIFQNQFAPKKCIESLLPQNQGLGEAQIFHTPGFITLNLDNWLLDSWSQSCTSWAGWTTGPFNAGYLP